MQHFREITGTLFSGTCAVVGHVAADPLGVIAYCVGIAAGLATVAQVIHNWSQKHE